MKHVKIRAEYIPIKNRVRLYLLQQTHLARDFGRSSPSGVSQALWNYYGNCSFNLDDSCLVSHPGNSFAIGFGVKNWLLLPYYDLHSRKPIMISLEDWKWIKPLVEAYNEWGATQE